MVLSPGHYHHAEWASRFKTALRDVGKSTDAIYEAGYSSSSRAYENISAQLGMTPSAFRRNGQGTTIRYSIATTDLGKLLIATTERGLCAVRFGERESALTGELRREFGAADIARDDRGLRPLPGQVRGLLREGSAGSL